MYFLETGGARPACFADGPDDGVPLLCIHGSWDDHHSWDGLVAQLPGQRIVRYDRRGHSRSSAPPGQGRLSEDVDDALAILDALAVPRAHVVGHSYGANVSIVLAARAGDRVASLSLHEPPVFGLLAKGSAGDQALRDEAGALMKQAAALIEAGETEAGARLFIEHVAFGPGSWTGLFDEQARRMILTNAPTWLDQFHDPERLAVNVEALRDYPGPITITTGIDSLPSYKAVVRHIAGILPAATIRVVGGGHGAHISHPADVAGAIGPVLASVPA